MRTGRRNERRSQKEARDVRAGSEPRNSLPPTIKRSETVSRRDKMENGPPKEKDDEMKTREQNEKSGEECGVDGVCV